ncbi:MAG TPA: YHYH protein [Candidatus Saccharimonadales bacterium]|nr:YHYH protein [Candidatus Saccharimonadales bacterium]
MEGEQQSAPQLEPIISEKRPFWKRRLPWLIIILILILGLGTGGYFLTHKNKAPANANLAATKPISSTPANPNHWKDSVNPAAIPLGDGKVSSSPQAGYVDSCTTKFRGGGAQTNGSWINKAGNTWDSQTKVAVEGAVTWPAADHSEKDSASTRALTTNDLPKGFTTGIFPIAKTDPAYQYDRNPNSIGTQSITYELPMDPAAAAVPGCTGLGPIGILSNGVVLFNALDDGGRDAVAHETQDSCNGHPNQQEMYHYHNIPVCIRNEAKGSSTLVGYALDGYGIYVERDAEGNLPTNADLDVCHGRTSEVTWNGKKTTMYHYDATLEYPYTLGCYHGTPTAGPSHTGTGQL